MHAWAPCALKAPCVPACTPRPCTHPACTPRARCVHMRPGGRACAVRRGVAARGARDPVARGCAAARGRARAARRSAA
eukprot:scaffold108600_cov43-Phaeocystis_antarctica.AAC.1